VQWDKVKNTLLVILLAVNLFLLSSLGVKLWQSRQRDEQLEDSLRTLTAAHGLTLDEAFSLPRDRLLPQLMLDRSRAEEEAVSLSMLGEDAVRTELEDGAVRFESEKGALVWGTDGTVQGECRTETETPADAREMEQTAQRLLSAWGLLEENSVLTAETASAVLTGTVAGMPVHNRQLTLELEEERAVLSGVWSFGTPYTTAQESGTVCAAADALLAFAEQTEEPARVLSMTAGYRLTVDSSRRLRLMPTWKITTDLGEYLVDCAKKTTVEPEK
jgi:hypothetical protein